MSFIIIHAPFLCSVIVLTEPLFKGGQSVIDTVF